jgi:hypothetical protein
MRRRLLLGLVPLVPLSPLLFAGCDTPGVSLGLSMLSPEGLLDEATSVTLYVFDASLAQCDATTGHASQIPMGSAQSFPLGTKGCPNGDQYCATIQLAEDDSTQMFAVEATRGTSTLAEGCVTKAIDQNPLSVDIQIHRYTPASCCNDGALEPGEQCDPGVPAKGAGKCGGIPADGVCESDCTAKEILLSLNDKDPPGLVDGPAGTKTGLAMAFGPGGLSTPIMLRAVYTSTDSQALGTSDVHESFLGEDLYPIPDPFPLSLQLELPLLCSNVQSAQGVAREQESPVVAPASDDTVAVVYATNEATGATFDVALSPQTADGCFDDIPCTANSDCQTSCNNGTCAPSILLNTISGGCSDPRAAAAGVSGTVGTVLATWTRMQGVVGRIWRTDGNLVPSMGEISIAPQGSSARVAGDANGFLVVYHGTGAEDPDGVYLTTVSPSGEVGTPQLVNQLTDGTQDQPDVALLADGASIVVFRSGGDIFFQRYTKAGKQVAGDQDAPLNTVSSPKGQSNPAVAGNSGFFTAAWETTNMAGPNIAARFIGESSGFGYNTVTWQNDEFIATSLKQPGERHLPAVAMGTYVALGWQDVSATHPGIFVRRFPAPTE